VYAKCPIEERRAVHERYNFDCACVACDREWPTLFEGGGIETRVMGLKEDAYKQKPVCNKSLKRLFQMADRALEQQRVILCRGCLIKRNGKW
jgi:hypothetical protein